MQGLHNKTHKKMFELGEVKVAKHRDYESGMKLNVCQALNIPIRPRNKTLDAFRESNYDSLIERPPEQETYL